VSSVVAPSTGFPAAPPPAISVWLKLFIAAVVMMVGALLVLAANPVVAALPLILVVLCYLVVAMPLRMHLAALVFAGSLSDTISIELPNKGGVWLPPFNDLRILLFENLNKVVPIEALRFSFVDLMYILMVTLAVVRTAMKIRVDGRGSSKSTVVLDRLLVIAFLTVAGLAIYGVFIRGGDLKQTLWQIRQMIWLPVVIGLFVYALRDAKDFARMIDWMILAACIKIGPAVWFFFKVARPLQFEPPTLTSHYDSVLFVVAFMALLIRFLHDVSWKNGLLFATLGGWIMFGNVLNNRRLSFVSFGVAIILVIIILRGPVKKVLRKALIILAPLIAVYLVVGQNKTSTIFKPARQIMSVTNQDDRSSGTRDIENFNLIWTLKRNKIVGAGWGHEYVELVRADDISTYFAQYRFIAHNSVLWLWTVGGLVGFTVIWMQIVVGIFFARRAYLFARSPLERDTAATALVMLSTYMMQAWGDMGVMGLNSTLTAGLAIAMSAKLAVATGAFPVRMRMFNVQLTPDRVEHKVTWPVAT
jgi:O-Antigen ligase